MLVLLNFSDDTIELRLPVNDSVAATLSGESLDLLAGENAPANPVRIKPFDARILTRPDAAKCK